MPPKKDVLAFALFCLIWVVPMTFSGLFNTDFPLYPRTLCYLEKMSRLFTHSIESWQVFYVQLKHAGSDEWTTVREEDFFRLKPFGYRTRLHQILARTKDMQGYARGEERSEARREELLAWMARRYGGLYPYKPPVERMRIVSAFMPIVDRKLIAGAWSKPPVEFFADEQKAVLIDRMFYY